jgi:hypothetical protein
MRTRLRSSLSGESEDRIGPEGIVRAVCVFWVFLFIFVVYLSYKILSVI